MTSSSSKVDVLINRFESTCDITGNLPTKEILDITSTNNRALADYQKKQRGWLESSDEIALLTMMWEQGHGKRADLIWNGEHISIDQAKSMLSAKANQGLVSVMMATPKTLKKVIAGCIDDRFSVFDHLKGTFPSGILPEVLSAIKQANLNVTVKDRRVKPTPRYTDWGLDAKWATLRAPQEAMKKLCQEHEHFGIEWCVGSGKTLGLILPLVIHQVDTLFVVPSVDLVQQTATKIAQCTNINPEQIGSCYGSDMQLRPITVTTVSTLERHLKEFKAFGFKQILVDEAHHAGARGLYEAVNEIEAYYRYFASGTLYREDHEKRIPGKLDLHGENMLLKALIGEVKDYRSYKDGVDAGYLCPVTVDCVDPGPKLEGCGYKTARDKGVVNNAYRNSGFANRIKQEVALGKTVLCLVVETEHADVLRETLLDVGVSAEAITGKTKASVRESVLDDLRNRRIQCVIGTSCIRTGVDIGTLDVVANVGGLKSYRSTIQGTGRGTRAGKLEDEAGVLQYVKHGATILDSMDKHHVSLSQHAMQRMLAYHKEGFAVPHLEEHFREEEEVRRRQKDRAVRSIKSIRKARASKLPSLRQQLVELQILLDDPDSKSAMSMPQIRKHIARIQSEINSIEAEGRRDAQLGELTGETDD